MSKRKKKMSAEADKYVLYQASVQMPDHEAWFIDKQFKRLFGRKAIVMREDFCGTHAICCEWVKRAKDKIAIGVDLDPEPLAWGIKHNQGKLKDEQRERITLVKGDVLEITDEAEDDGNCKADVIAAENFSYFCFTTRDALRTYFEAAWANLQDEGLFLLDMLGGSEMHLHGHEDVRKVDGHKGVKYVWEQEKFNPITHDARFHIHFRFKDGSKLSPAFTYEWRMWSLPEICELLVEAGFDDVQVMWEGTDKDGEPNHKFKVVEDAEPDPSWVCYVLAVKKKAAETEAEIETEV